MTDDTKKTKIQLIDEIKRLREEIKENKSSINTCNRLEEKLKKNEKQLYSLINKSSDIIYTLDPKGIFTFINNEVSNYGYSPEELIGTNILDMVYSEDREKATHRVNERRTGDRSTKSFELRLFTRTEQTVPFEFKSQGIEAEATFLVTAEGLYMTAQPETNGLVGTQGIARDITERKRIDELLHTSEEKFRTLVSNIPGAVYRCKNDPDWTMEYISGTIQEITGYPASDFIGNKVRTYSSIIHPEDKDKVLKFVQDGVTQKKAFTGEYRIIHVDGSYKWVYEKVQGVFGKDGQILWLDGVILDITSRKQTEEELRRKEENNKLLAESITDVVSLHDLDGTFLYVSPSVQKLSGWIPEEIIGSKFYDRIHPEDVDLVYNEVEKKIKEGLDAVAEWRCICKDGSQKWIETITHVITDIEGKPYRMICSSRNITSRKNAEDELQHYKVHLEELLQERTKDLAHINQKLKMEITEHQQTENKLRESEEKYRTVFENTGMATVIIEKDMTISLANTGFVILSGYTKEEIEGKIKWTEFVLEEDVERMGKYHYQRREIGGKAPKEYEFKFIDKNKNVKDVYVTVALIPGSKSIASLLDITYRKQTEEAIKESGKKFQQLYDEAPVGYHELDREGKIVQVNKTETDMLGYTVHDMLGKSIFNFIAPEERKAAKEAYRLKIKKHQPVKGYERKYIRKNGEAIYFSIMDRQITDNEGKIIGMRSTLQDITERKKAEEEIKMYYENLELMVAERTRELNRALYDTEVARDRIDGILKSVGEGMIVTDVYNRVLVMNRRAEELLGVRLSEVINRSVEFAVEDKILLNSLKTTLSKDADDRFNFELAGSGGEEARFMQARTSVIHDKTGNKTGVVTIFYDITREHEVDRMKTDFISTAAHELRTPLTSIQGFSEILLTRDNITPEDQNRFLNYINKQSVKLAHIISDLLDISRIESGHGFEFNPEGRNINDVITLAVSYFRELSRKHTFEIILPDRPVELLIDQEKIEQVMKNILGNAVKYSPDGGVIKVVGETVEDYYRVMIQDQGIGMTQKDVANIFEKFYRADALKSAVEGTGLGMNIVKYIVEKHGGNVFIDSESGKGTVVTFTVPL